MPTSIHKPTGGSRSRSDNPSLLRRLVRRPAGVFGLGMLALLVIGALWPSAWLPFDPIRPTGAGSLLPPSWVDGGSPEHILGTDSLGRDILSRLVSGSQQTVLVVGLAAAIALSLGVTVGMLAGYYRGIVEMVLMFIVDIALAFPVLILLIAAIAAFGPSTTNLILILGVAGFAPFARLVRGQVLSLREKPFIEAARASGAGGARMIFTHLLPNCMTGLIVFLTFDIAGLVLLEASLSFLGLGIQPPYASWGGMIADGQQYMFVSPWAAILPGIAILLTVTGLNFLGDEIRDALDPTHTHRATRGGRTRMTRLTASSPAPLAGAGVEGAVADDQVPADEGERQRGGDRR